MHVEFFEDLSGIDYIRVENPDGTFELFAHGTDPTDDELIAIVLAKNGITNVKEIEPIIDRYVYTQREYEAKLREIKTTYGIPEESTPGSWENDHADKKAARDALAEWETWFEGRLALRLLP